MTEEELKALIKKAMSRKTDSEQNDSEQTESLTTIVKQKLSESTESDNSEKESQSNVLDRIKALKAQSGKAITKDVHIEVIGHESRVAKTGDAYDYVIYDVRPVGASKSLTETRRTPTFTEESDLLIDTVDNKPESIYRTTSEKNERGYYQYTSIEKIGELPKTDFFEE